MVNNWIPGPASPALEKLMEVMDLPESDRDELRRFSEFLRRRARKKSGEQVPPAPQGMVDWLMGRE